jgi:hypothetical protein
VIAPGGGYQHLAIDKEGHDVFRWLNTIGIGALVLKYRLPGGMRGQSQSDIHQIADKIHVALEMPRLLFVWREKMRQSGT